MSTIRIELGAGPDGQPVGHLTGEVVQPTGFTGWLELIRLLDEELAASRFRLDPPLSNAP
jgi:hypothetical protein